MKFDFEKIGNLKNLNKENIKANRQVRKERREQALERRHNSKFFQKMQPVYKWMNRLSPVLHFVLACFLNFYIEAFSRHSVSEAWKYFQETPRVFFFNAFLITVTFSIVYLFKRRIFVRIALCVFWAMLGTVNGYMLINRVTPFNAQDLKTLSEGKAMLTKYFTPIELVGFVILIAAIVILVIAIWKRGGQYQGKIHYILSVAGVCIWVGAYVLLTNFAIENRVISNYFGNVAFAYQDYGFPYCFTASIFNTGIDQPSGYNAETIDKISNNGDITKNETGRASDELPNILVVQLETFLDPTEIEFLTFSSDPIPNIRAMFEEYSTGYFKVPSVGAGTANTEFEVLTGMSMRFFGPGEYPYKTYVKEHTCESAATALGSLGYGAEALHNNGGNFYSRAKVFNNMGFDHFTSEEFMNVLQMTPNGWATDDILIPHILDAMDTTEGQDFVFTISVEGHGDYPEERVYDNPDIVVGGVEDEGKRNAWEYYVNQVYKMDDFAGDLIEEIEKRGEPTVVVFYGDHLPTMNLEAADMKSRYLYNTNYVIWDNIGLEKKDMNLAAYQLMAEVMERLDIHSGTLFNYHQSRRQSKNYLADLEVLQYDILYGKQYVYEESGHPITEGHMVMGVKDVTVNDIVTQMDGTYSIYGENFTRNSKIFVNGEKQTSSFLNNTRIELKEIELKNGDLIEISQVGSSNTIFRTSETYVYEDGAIMLLADWEALQEAHENNGIEGSTEESDAEVPVA